MLRNLIKLVKPGPQLTQLIDLLVPQLLCLLVLFFQLGQFLSQECKSLSSVLYLLKHIWLTLLNDVVQLLLSSQLVHLQLSLQFLLLLDFFLSGLQVSFQVDEEVWLLDQLKSLLQFVVLFHQVHYGLVCVLQVSLSLIPVGTDI